MIENKQRMKRIVRRVLFMGVPLVLLATVILSGLACDVGTAIAGRTLVNYSTGHQFYDGAFSVDETIMLTDVIVRGRLTSVNRGVDVWKHDKDVVYSKTLEYTFDVTEYLKGKGGDQVVGLVFDDVLVFNTRLGAELGKDIDPEHDDYYDGREAIIFLTDDSKDSRISLDKDRYRLGTVRSGTWRQRYSIQNPWYRPWLPSAKKDSGLFLLEPDRGVDSPRTISYDELKLRIGYIEEQIAGQSEEYIDCILYNYSWQREVSYRKEEELGGKYHYRRGDVDVGSGIAAGTAVWEHHSVPITRDILKDIPPSEHGKYVLAGSGAKYFRGVLPGYILVARPLPAGTYSVFHSQLPYQASMCGGTTPEVEMGRSEVFVNVTAPDGTLHEAFFDPVTDGTEPYTTYGKLEPPTFKDATGAIAAIARISWVSGGSGTGTVEMIVAPHASIADHTIDFIALDGSVALSLAMSDAGVDASGMLTWTTAFQPWQGGDKLLVRVSAPAK